MTRVLFFGKVAEAMGREHEVDVPADGCTIADLRKLIAAQTGADALLQKGVRASVDKQVAGEEALVSHESEVAFFSVFSGG